MASVRTVYEGYTNNYFQPSTPQIPAKVLTNGKVKGSPQNYERIHNQINTDNTEDPDRPFVDIIRDSDNVANRDSSGNYLSTAFHSASKDSSQATIQGLNSVHFSLKSHSPVNGITQDKRLKTSSNSELTSLVKSDANFNTNIVCQNDINTEPNDNFYETDTLLVRCGSTGHTCKRFNRCENTLLEGTDNALQNGTDELKALNGNDNKVLDSAIVTMNSVV